MVNLMVQYRGRQLDRVFSTLRGPTRRASLTQLRRTSAAMTELAAPFPGPGAPCPSTCGCLNGPASCATRSADGSTPLPTRSRAERAGPVGIPIAEHGIDVEVGLEPRAAEGQRHGRGK